MRFFVATAFTIGVLSTFWASTALAKRFYIDGTAVCLNCGDPAAVPIRTTGKGYPTKAECDKTKREMSAYFRKNGFRLQIRCKLK
jgi:hypothetical protein